MTLERAGLGAIYGALDRGENRVWSRVALALMCRPQPPAGRATANAEQPTCVSRRRLVPKKPGGAVVPPRGWHERFFAYRCPPNETTGEVRSLRRPSHVQAVS